MIHKLAARFNYLDSLIRKRATGSPKELAERLGLTERGWYKLRDELVNDLLLPLAYDSQRQTYYYPEEGQLIFEFRRKLSPGDMEKLQGGQLRGSFSEIHSKMNHPYEHLNCSLGLVLT